MDHAAEKDARERESAAGAEALWDRLLERDRGAYVAGLEDFRASQLERKVRYGDRPLCNHLRPKFLTRSEERDLRSAAEAVMRAVSAVGRRYLDDLDGAVDALGIRDFEREMIEPDPGYSHIAPCVRLDSFITPEGPRFVELNGECPAGPGYSDRLADVFLEHSLTRAFAAQRTLEKISTLPPLLDTILACWDEFSGASEPTIAIVDYDHVPTRWEFEICREWFEGQGHRTLVVDPRELDYDGRELRARGERIDLVYKRVLMNEFVEKFEEVKNLWLAYRDGNVCIVNPFRSKLVHKKAIFAVLTGEGRESWLDAETIREIDRSVPWTRRLREGRTRYRDETVDLLSLLRGQRENFVIKPNDDYGGKGITLGWEADEATWAKALESGLRSDHVVQERIRLVGESFPGVRAELGPETLFVDLDPYLYLGRMGGVLARLGAGSLCNVTSGGGQVPVMVVDDDEEGAS